MKTLRVTKGWTAVPVAIILDSRLRFDSRIVLAYMLGYPPTRDFFAWKAQKDLSISKDVWGTIRTQLEQFHYVSHKRDRDKSGRVVWRWYVTDGPVSEDQNVSTVTPPRETKAKAQCATSCQG